MPAKELINRWISRRLANRKNSQKGGGPNARATMSMEMAGAACCTWLEIIIIKAKNSNNFVAFSTGSNQLRAVMNESYPSAANHRNLVAAVSLASLLVLCDSAHSAMLIQITPDNPSTTGTGFVVSSSGWNVLSPSYNGTTGLQDYQIALLDSAGASTGISLAADNTNRFNAYNSTGSQVASSGFPADVKSESFFGNSDGSFNADGFVQETATWEFGGFNQNDELIFTFYASRMGVENPETDNREGKYQVVGATTLFTTLNATNNVSNTAQVSVKADANGKVVLNMTKGGNNTNQYGFFYLNAMTVQIVPEPSSALLVLVTGLGLCMVRRRG